MHKQSRRGYQTQHIEQPNFLNSLYITSQKKREAAVAKPITAVSAPAAGTVVVAKGVDTGISPAADRTFSVYRGETSSLVQRNDIPWN